MFEIHFNDLVEDIQQRFLIQQTFLSLKKPIGTCFRLQRLSSVGKNRDENDELG